MCDWAERSVDRVHADRILIDTRLAQERDHPPPDVTRTVQLKDPGLPPHRALASFLRQSTIEMFAVRPGGRLVVQFMFWTEAQKAFPLLSNQAPVFAPPWEHPQGSSAVLMLGGAALPVLLRHIQCLLGTVGDAHFTRVMSAKDLPRGLETELSCSFSTFPHPHFLFVRYTQPLVALRAVHQLQRRLFDEFGLTLLVTPEKYEMDGQRQFSVSEHLSLYAQPRLWTHPRSLQSQIMVGTISTINDTMVELKFAVDTYGVIQKADAIGTSAAEEVSKLKVGQRVRARIQGMSTTEGWTWYHCSLSETMLLPDSDVELLAKVKRLDIRDDDCLELFDIVDGIVVEADDTYLKVDIGHVREFAYLSAPGNGWQPQQQFQVGDPVSARIHRVTRSCFPAIELATGNLDILLKGEGRAKDIALLKASHVMVGKAYKGLIVRVTKNTAEVYIGCPKFLEVVLPVEGSAPWGAAGPQVGNWVQCTVQSVHPLKIVGTPVLTASLETADREAMSLRLKQLVQQQKLAMTSKARKPSAPTSPLPNVLSSSTSIWTRPTVRTGPATEGPTCGALRVTNVASSVDEVSLAQFFRKFARDRCVVVKLCAEAAADHQTAFIRLTHEADAVTAAMKATNKKLGTSQNNRTITVEVIDAATVEWPNPKAGPIRTVIARAKPNPKPTATAATAAATTTSATVATNAANKAKRPTIMVPPISPAIAVAKPRASTSAASAVPPLPRTSPVTTLGGAMSMPVTASVLDSYADSAAAPPPPRPLTQQPPPRPGAQAAGINVSLLDSSLLIRADEEDELANLSPNPRKRARSHDSIATVSEATSSSRGSRSESGGGGSSGSTSTHNSSRESHSESSSCNPSPAQTSQHSSSPSPARSSSHSSSSVASVQSPRPAPSHLKPPRSQAGGTPLTAATLADHTASIIATTIPPAPICGALQLESMPSIEDEERSVYSTASSTRHTESCTPERYHLMFLERWEELKAKGWWPP
eukprot:GGOE01015217.1.p1 GENE.GGOE01015217.1~~GGOE01015217.1.p1  ORF type:complete len:1110 (+),score=257.11 GGOE01015217.1:371-3331(+)